MGNTCVGETENAEIVTGTGQYHFKKTRKAFNDNEALFYGKNKNVYDENKKKIIERQQSMKRAEGSSWTNGNVVVIPL